jgi:glutamyl-tRNA synthetase
METMINKGLAYADDTPADRMKEERDEGIASKHRTNDAKTNLKHFQEMQKGTPEGLKFCIRAKLDMTSLVKCMRDPVFYRCNVTSHHRTGTKYKAYPTYDFACPIVDSIEGVTHAMRSIEYHDRNTMYDWVIESLGLRPVRIYDFSRLNLVSTILSKRNLQWFVDKNHVEGWYDPRFPTVQGILRRGMTVEALKNFMLEQGPSKNTNLMEWDKLWSTNIDIIDPHAKRFMGVEKETAIKLSLSNGPNALEGKSVPLHPKNDLGTRVQMYYKELFLEFDDAKTFEEGEKVTLRNWGNVFIEKITKGKSGKPHDFSMTGKLALDDNNFKKTKKVHWVPNHPDTLIEFEMVEFDMLINKKKFEVDDKIEDVFNHGSRIGYTGYGDGSLKTLQKGEHI